MVGEYQATTIYEIKRTVDIYDESASETADDFLILVFYSKGDMHVRIKLGG